MAAESNKLPAEAEIRAIRAQDAEAVTAILGESPEAASWSKENYLALAGWGGVLGFVSESAGQVTGFVIGRQVADEGEILNLAVRPVSRRRGEGRALLSALLERFRLGRVTRVYLEVRESNRAAIAFYEKYDFKSKGRRPGYYRDPEEAAVTMEKIITG